MQIPFKAPPPDPSATGIERVVRRPIRRLLARACGFAIMLGGFAPVGGPALFGGPEAGGPSPLGGPGAGAPASSVATLLAYVEFGVVTLYAGGALHAQEEEEGEQEQGEEEEAVDETAEADSTVTTTQGVFSEEQAARGEEIFWTICSECHFEEDFGGPFIQSWASVTVKDLLDEIIATMPEDNPGGMPLQEYIDVITYLFKINGMPAGEDELTEEELDAVKIDYDPDAGGDPPPEGDPESEDGSEPADSPGTGR